MMVASNRKGDWIQTWSGRQFWPLDPRPEEIFIDDIAHALGNICRFTGHCLDFYSVAEHCLHVSMWDDPEFALIGLLHDASEAYLCDIPRPVKPYIMVYKELENAIERSIFERFGIGADVFSKGAENVKRIDSAMLATEA